MHSSEWGLPDGNLPDITEEEVDDELPMAESLEDDMLEGDKDNNFQVSFIGDSSVPLVRQVAEHCFRSTLLDPEFSKDVSEISIYYHLNYLSQILIFLKCCKIVQFIWLNLFISIFHFY